MQFTINVGLLKTTLAEMAKVVKPNKGIPILGYVHVISKNGVLLIQGTDHKVFYSVEMNSATHTDDLDMMLNLNETHTMLSRLDKNNDVEFEIDEDSWQLVVRSGTTIWKKDIRPSVDFPTFPDMGDSVVQAILSDDLLDILNSAMRTTPVLTFNPGLTQIQIKDGYVESGDGGVHQRIFCEELGSIDITIPIPSVKILLAILRAWKGKGIYFGSSDKYVIAASDNTIVVFTTYAHEFPDLSGYLDKPKITHVDKLNVIVKEFTNALSAAGLATDESNMVTITINGNRSLTVSSRSPHGGAAEVKCSCTWEGPPRTLHVDYKKLLATLAATGEKDHIDLRLGPEVGKVKSPIYIHTPTLEAAITQMRGV